MRGNHSISAST